VLEGPTSEWIRRVRGQVSDLPVAISTLALLVEGQPEPELARQLRPLAEHRDAALVAWLITEKNDLGSTRVAIWFARSGRFFSRSLAGPWHRLSASDRSGVLEIGALTVRSAVRSLLLDPSQQESEPFTGVEPPPSTGAQGAASASAATIAPSVGAASAAPSTSSATTPAPGASNSAPNPAAPSQDSAASNPEALSPSGATAPAGVGTDPLGGSAARDSVLPQDRPIVVTRERREVATDQPSAEATSSSDALALDWNVELGVVGQLPGPPGDGALSASLGLHARQGAWGVLITGQVGLPVRAELGPSKVQVLQHALLAEAQYLGWNTGVWSFGPLARAGLSLSRRETVAGDPGLAASEAKWLSSPRFGRGWATELRWSQHFGATLRGVVHWDPVRHSYAVVNQNEQLLARAEPWAVQPSLELCANWYW
jgi:hypothetical protein